MAVTINRVIFYNLARSNPFGGRLTQQNVDGTNAILDAWEADYSNEPLEGLAYILATAFGETGTMKWDVREGAPRGETRTAYFTRMYDIRGSRPAKARELGNLLPGDGAKYYGRSFPQITGKRNYAEFTKLLQAKFPGIDLVSNPDGALDKDVGAEILLLGMYRGIFTGRKLGDYFDGKAYPDAEMKRRRIEARRIINGTDKAEAFARVAAAFSMALRAATVAPSALFEVAEAAEPQTARPQWVRDLEGASRGLPAGVPPILADLGGRVLNKAVEEASGGRVSLPVDKGKPLTSSTIIGGSLLAGIPGVLGAITSIQDRWVALAVVGAIVVGVVLVVTGRIKIQHEAGV